MSTTLSPPEKVSYGTWKYAWTGTAPFSVFDYRSYEFVIENSDDTEYYATSDDNTEPQAIEVFDATESTADAVGLDYPARVILQWRGYAYADYYEIQQETAPSTYTTVQTYLEDGSGYYKFVSPVTTDDVETASYRVVMYDRAGAFSNTDTEQVIIRHPSPPELTYTYNAGTGLLTIAAA